MGGWLNYTLAPDYIVQQYVMRMEAEAEADSIQNIPMVGAGE